MGSHAPLLPGIKLDPIEIAGAITGVACVALTVRQSVWCWPIGLANSALYLWVFSSARLYSDAVLQGFYFLMSVYGWYHWLYPSGDGARAELPITRASARELLTLAALGSAGTLAWGSGLAKWTDAAFPYLDTATMMASLAAQWLLTRKRIENWYIWIVADLVMIGIYYAKALYPTTLLYLVFTGLAVSGLVTWRRDLK